jgi:hypothetical protein
MTNLSPAALAVWEAFNEDEPGAFIDYGDCLAAALRAAADQLITVNWSVEMQELHDAFHAIANELAAQ